MMGPTTLMRIIRTTGLADVARVDAQRDLAATLPIAPTPAPRPRQAEARIETTPLTPQTRGEQAKSPKTPEPVMPNRSPVQNTGSVVPKPVGQAASLRALALPMLLPPTTPMTHRPVVPQATTVPIPTAVQQIMPVLAPLVGQIPTPIITAIGQMVSALFTTDDVPNQTPTPARGDVTPPQHPASPTPIRAENPVTPQMVPFSPARPSTLPQQVQPQQVPQNPPVLGQMAHPPMPGTATPTPPNSNPLPMPMSTTTPMSMSLPLPMVPDFNVRVRDTIQSAPQPSGAPVLPNLIDELQAIISAPQTAPTQTVTMTYSRDMTLYLALNAALIPGWPYLGNIRQSINDPKIRDRLARLAQTLRDMPPEHRAAYLASLGLPAQTLSALDQIAKSVAQDMSDAVNPDTLAALMALIVLAFSAMAGHPDITQDE